MLATQTGVLVLTGALTAAAGLTLTPPTWTVPIDCLTVCSPAWLVPEVWLVELLLLEPPFWVAWLPGQLLATQTGVLVLTGALTAAAGLTLTLPTWTVPIDCLTVCSPAWLVPEVWLVELLLLEPPFWVAWLPGQLLATQTGVLVLTGALTAAAGLTLTLPTWTVPIDWLDRFSGSGQGRPCRRKGDQDTPSTGCVSCLVTLLSNKPGC